MITLVRTKLFPLLLAIVAIVAAIVATSSLVKAKSSNQPEVLVATSGRTTTASAKAKCPKNVTKRMCKLYRAMLTAAKDGGFKWDRIGCYRATDSYPYHPSGRACDLMYGPGGTAATGSNKSDGDRMRAWLVKNHKKYGIDHVMWRGKVYSPRGNWAGYAQSGCGKRPAVTACHYDHVHVAVT